MKDNQVNIKNSQTFCAAPWVNLTVSIGGNGTMGTFIVQAEYFFKTRGYDEAFDAWGGEDKDLYERLDLLGLKKLTYPSSFVTTIPHSDQMRQLGSFHEALASKNEQVKLCKTYRDIKNKIMKLEGVNLNLDCRIDIMAQVKSFFKNSIPSVDAIEISYSLKEGLGHKKTHKFTIN